MSLRHRIAAGIVSVGIASALVALPGADRPAHADVASPAGGDLFSLVGPFRFGDTRPGANHIGPNNTLISNVPIDVLITGVGGIPPDASAVSGTVTAVPLGQAGHLTVFPSGGAVPNVSSVNFGADQNPVANFFIAPIGANGRLSIVSPVATDAIIDINGYFGPNGNSVLARIGGSRLFDATLPAEAFQTAFFNNVTVAPLTRGSTVSPGSMVPHAFFGNFTIDNPGGAGFFQPGPFGTTVAISASNWIQGQTRPNTFLTGLRDAAIPNVGNRRAWQFFLRRSGGRVIIDDMAVFGDASAAGVLGFGYRALSPCRVADTRSGSRIGDVVRLLAGRRATLPISGRCGVPPAADVYGVFGNFTLVNPAAQTHLTVGPSGVALPGTSIVNAPPGGVVANSTFVRVGDDGGIDIVSPNDTDVIFDVLGYVPYPPTPN